MNLAPTSPDIGIQPHGHTARVINREASTALALGDVVCTSFGHGSVTYPATTIAEARLTPFAGVVRASGTGTGTKGYIGVVVDLGNSSGAAGTEVVVQFGGIVNAKVTATTAAVAFGAVLGIDDTAGEGFGNAAGATSTFPAAISLNTTNVAIGATSIVPCLVSHDLWYGADI